MAARGVHFALTANDAARLAPERRTDEGVLALVDELEERWDEEWWQVTDKAWDAIHRCLTDGTLRPGNTALHKCVLGTADAYGGGDYLVNFLTPLEVREAAAA